MLRWNRPRQRFDQLDLLLGRRVHGRVHAVGHQGEQTAIMPPILQLGWLVQHLHQERFVVAFQAYRFVGLAAPDQHVENVREPGPRST